jgi:hypothetical protein
MSDQWQINNNVFTWLSSSVGGVPVRKQWERTPRLVVRPILGGGTAAIDNIGYQPWQVSGPVMVESDGIANTLRGLNGLSASVNDGIASHLAVCEIQLSRTAENIWVGDMTLTRPGGGS